ncbi:MAG: V-type ATP synthase subunit I [Bacteroidetes bacterium 4572_77]|nr:MAG: V-type ATP synthase subunit I [Bacteroidetes bacterium 4572_77]
MIIAMQKYSFLVFHKEYKDFLNNMQQLGVLHVVEKEKLENDHLAKGQQLLKSYDQTLKFLEKRRTEEESQASVAHDLNLIETIAAKQDEISSLEQELPSIQKELVLTEPWGDFSLSIINKLKSKNYYLRFFTCSKKKFKPTYLSDYNTEVVSEKGNVVYFVVVQKGNESIDIDAEEVKPPAFTLAQLEKQKQEIAQKMEAINKEFEAYANSSIPQLELEREKIAASVDYEKVFLNTASEAQDKMKILEAWVPETNQKQVEASLEENNILYIKEKASNKDKVPILLKNNRFSKLFEPIGKLFSLPAYAEMDLTVFFAPFFMMFFGFCLGDAGYGLVFVIGAGLYKLKAKKELKPLLSLVQILGVATVIFGIVSGTFFGINLIDADVNFLADYKSMFLNPDNMFNLALILGAFQIVFAMFIKAFNQIKQYGFTHSLATFGWLIVIIGSGIFVALSKYEIIESNNIILYSILSLGGFLIIFFSDVEISIPARIGKGVWDIYSTVTGIFGDLLSYIRLFALGLSSAILGFVINDIAIQILGSSAIFGPVFFVVFLLLGHGLNILISSLGSFVHPMRLTFVEFYKNAGFQGGGKEYKPFKVK